MLRRREIPLILLLTLLLPACLTPVPREDWPVQDDPLFASAVWVHGPDGWGSGALIHSSARGTYVLTAAHVVCDDDGYVPDDAEVDVGVWDQSHDPAIHEPYATYRADVVAATAPRGPSPEGPDAGTAAIVDWIAGRDLAILRLRTDRRFTAAPLYTGAPDGIADAELVVVAVLPKMYPHRKPAMPLTERVFCYDTEDGNSGAPVFANGEVVGVCTSELVSPGPKQIRELIEAHEKIRFLLEAKEPAPAE